MKFWQEIVEPDTTPAEVPEKSKYNTARLVGAAIVEEFRVMVQEGLEYSYLTNGLMDVQLWLPFDDPGILYYDLGDPSIDRTASVGRLEIPRSRLGRALCLCLMSFRSSCRHHAWRENALHKLPTWHSSFDSERSQISITELYQSVQNMECASSGHYDLEQATSELLPSSSSAGRRYRVKRTFTVSFGLHKARRSQFSLERLTWPESTSYTAQEKYATCSLWAEAARI